MPIPQESSQIASAPDTAQARSLSVQWPDLVAVAAVCVGIGLWVVSALGLDPTNVPQRQDFERFHFPSLLGFAQQPFAEAIADYPAAPFPLFYMLSGALYWLTGSILALKLWTVALGLALLACVFALARARFSGARDHAYLLLAVALISPYFRGQSVYANTDILALVFAFAALYAFGQQAPRFPSARALAAFGLACCAVYTRQFYVFLPAYLLLRTYSERPLREALSAAALCALLAMPVIALVAFWGGVTPPGFDEHASVSLADSVPTVIALLAFYALPMAVLTAWKHRSAFVADLRRPALLATSVPLLLLGGYLLVRNAAIPSVVGGGMPLHVLRALPVPEAWRGACLVLTVVTGGLYLAYIVLQDPRRNAIVPLIALCFFPTGILYQRYFDPLFPLTAGTLLSARELSPGSARATVILMVALELVVTAVGFAHYRTVFSGAGP